MNVGFVGGEIRRAPPVLALGAVDSLHRNECCRFLVEFRGNRSSMRRPLKPILEVTSGSRLLSLAVARSDETRVQRSAPRSEPAPRCRTWT